MAPAMFCIIPAGFQRKLVRVPGVGAEQQRHATPQTSTNNMAACGEVTNGYRVRAGLWDHKHVCDAAQVS